MMPFLIDTHCHLAFSAYDEDREAVLARMREQRIAAITIGTSLFTSERAVGLAEATNGIWASVGLHPEHLFSSFYDEAEGEIGSRNIEEADLERLVQSSSRVVAIGETGLDFFRLDEGRNSAEVVEEQEAVFRKHLAVAARLDLPVVIHCREALRRLAEMLQQEDLAGRRVRGVVHSFTGTWEQAKPLLDLGLSIGINGIATFPLKKNQRPEDAVDRTVERMPLERLVLETDAPYLSPVPFRGRRNEPTFVEAVAKHVAAVRRTDIDAVARTTTENAVGLFRLPVG